MKKYMLTIQIETRWIQVIIFDKKYKEIIKYKQDLNIFYPNDDWIEQDPIQIFHSTITCIMQTLNIGNIKTNEISGIGISNQAQTVVVWNKNTALPIYNAIVWNDRRTQKYCHHLSDDKKQKIKNKTGLIPSSYFSASKIQWILDEVPNARFSAKNGQLLFGTLETWIIWKLTNGRTHITDMTNASKTMLMNLKNLKWDKDMINIFNIPETMFPEIKCSSEVYGFLNSNIILNFSDHEALKIPICAAICNQSASLIAQHCDTNTDIKISIEKSSHIMINTGKKIIKNSGQITSTIVLALSTSESNVNYGLEGTVLIGDYATYWLKHNLGLIYHNKEISWHIDRLSHKKHDSSKIFFIPAFEGFAAPHWVHQARGAILGLDYKTKKEHIVKAAIESIAYQNNSIIKTIDKNLRGRIKNIKINGPLSSNAYLMQFQANLSQIKVLVNKEKFNLTALGVASIGWSAIGFSISLTSSLNNFNNYDIYTPNITIKEAVELNNQWKDAVNKILK